jgi:hypothetical protein
MSSYICLESPISSPSKSQSTRLKNPIENDQNIDISQDSEPNDNPLSDRETTHSFTIGNKTVCLYPDDFVDHSKSETEPPLQK